MSYQRNYVQNLLNGFMSTFVLYTACELGIFDILAEQTMKICDLAEELGVSEENLIRILRPLEQYKLLKLDENNCRLQETGKLLTTKNVDSLLPYALFCGRESVAVWSCLYPAIKKNLNPRDVLSESSIFSDMSDNPERFQIFNGMMSSVSRKVDLDKFMQNFQKKDRALRFADIGGGTGTIILKFLNYYSQATGMILDLEQARESAMENIEKHFMEKRCVFKVIDFFQPIEVEADVFLLSRVLHDWNDEQAKQILTNVANAMTDTSKLLILEEIIPDSEDGNALSAYMNDLQMWGFCGGKERSREEFISLVESVGLELERMDTTEGEGNFCVLTVFKQNMESGEI